MSYIGNTQQNQSYVPAVDFFSGDGSTTAFTLSKPVATTAQIQAVISNVPQTPGVAYTVSGSTITFTSAPPSGTNNIYVYYTSPNTQVVQPGQGTVYPSSLSTGGPYWSSTSNFGIGKTSYGSMTANGAWFSIADSYNQISTTSNVDATLYLNQNGTGDIQQWRVANAVKATLNTYGLGIGNATPSSGIGITFPATQSASSDANTLDDYEEGTWTPAFSAAAGTSTYDSQVGYYVKVGKNVFISGYIDINTASGTTSSQLFITGLPFTPASISGYPFTLSVNRTNAWNTAPVGGMFLNVTYFEIYKFGSASNTTDSLGTDLATNAQIRFAGWFEV